MAAVRRRGSAGSSVAVLGLKSLELAELYTRDAEQQQLAEGCTPVWEGKYGPLKCGASARVATD